MATLPVYLNSLTGKGVHLVTVNDYLARRDAEWMGRLYNFMGLTVGVNTPQMSREAKQAAYAADVTYGTNNEFGFDYLRDNMVQDIADRVARGLSYAIVDEVDSILIDEARTPLIISGQAEDHTEMYVRINAVVPELKKQIGELDLRTGEGVIEPGDFTVDEKTHQVFLTEDGHENAERLLREAGLLVEGASLYDPANITLMHHVYAALRAQAPLPPRPALRGAEGRGRHARGGDRRRVHRPPDDRPALERRPAPGGGGQGRRADPEREPDPRLDHLPELLPHVRQALGHDRHGRHRGLRVPGDLRPRDGGDPAEPADRSARTSSTSSTRPAREKFEAVIEDIRDCHKRGQPVLVGTTSIENSELVSGLLDKAKLPHAVLNAKQHAREAEIVAQAGRPGRDHDRHQHGRPRHRHRPRRQRREPDQDHRRRRVDPRGREAGAGAEAQGRVAEPARRRQGRRAACASSPPSGTSRGGSTTSCAAAPAARATRAPRASTSRSTIR